MPNIATLGLEFNTKSTASKIEKLCEKFDSLSAKCGDAQKAFEKFTGEKMVAAFEQLSKMKPIDGEVVKSVLQLSRAFKTLNVSNENAVKNLQYLTSFGNSTVSFSENTGKVVKSITEISTAFKQLNVVDKNVMKNIKAMTSFGYFTDSIKAINPETVKGIRDLASAFRTLNGVNTNVLKSISEMMRSFKSAMSVKILNDSTKIDKKNIDNINKASKETGKYSSELYGVYAHADAAAIAINSFVSAISVGIIKNATISAAEFGKELAYIKTLTDEFDTNSIGKRIMDFSSELGSASKNVKAFYYAYSSGMRGTEEDLLRFTEVNAKLAAVIRSDVIPTMNATTAAINAYDMSARDIGRVSDVFAAIVKYGKASGEQLASGIGQVIPTAATAGLTLEEMGAAIASLTKVMNTRNAITYLNNAISKMLKPTKASELEARKLGIELGLSAIRAKGFAAVMQEIHDKTQGNQEALLRLFPDLRGQRAALQLLNKGWGDFQAQLDNFKNSAGLASQQMEALMNDISAQISALPTTIQKVMTEAGKSIIEFVTLGGALTPVVRGFNEMGEGMRSLIGILVAGGSAIFAFKAGILAITSYQALQIRNNQIIQAQKARKIALQNVENAQTVRSVAMGKAEIYLAKEKMKIGEANALFYQKKIALQAQMLVESQAAYAASANQIKAEMQEAIARGQNSLALKLEHQYKYKSYMASLMESKAIAAETHALNAESTARLLNAKSALIESNAVKTSLYAKMKGIAVSAAHSVSIGIKSSVSGLGFMSAVPGAKALAGAIGALTPAVMKTSLAVAGMSTSILRLGNHVRIIDIPINALTKRLTTMKISLLAPIASFDALAAVCVKAGVSAAGTAVILSGMVALAAGLGLVIGALLAKIPAVKSFSEGFWENTMLKDRLDIEKERSEILDKQREITQNIKENSSIALDTESEILAMWQNAEEKDLTTLEKIFDINKRYNNAMDYANKNSIEAVRFAQAEYDNAVQFVNKRNQTLKEMEVNKKRVDDLLKKLQEASDAAKKANMNLLDIQKEGAELKKNIFDAFESFQKIFDDLDFDLMDPKTKSAEIQRRFDESVKNIDNAILNSNIDTVKKELESASANYSALYKEAQRIAEDNTKAIENINKALLDNAINSARTDAERYSIYEKEARKAFTETQSRIASGNFSSAIESLNTFNTYATKMVSAQTKLAQAEMNANRETEKLVLAMDKFKSSAVNAVNEFTSDAVELQARRFDALPAINPQNTAQNNLQNMNQVLTAVLQNFSTAITTALQDEIKNTQSAMDNNRNMMEYLKNAITDEFNSQKELLKGFATDFARSFKESLASDPLKVDVVKGGTNIKSVRL